MQTIIPMPVCMIIVPLLGTCHIKDNVSVIITIVIYVVKVGKKKLFMHGLMKFQKEMKSMLQYNLEESKNK